MGVKTKVSIVCVFVGCCVNVLVLEKLTNNISGIANLITFLQFIFISAEGFLFTSKCGTRRSLIPIKDCSVLVLLFFVSSVCNNFAYNFNVPTTLHIIIKSGSMVTNMGLGILLGRRLYTKQKYFSVVLITVGITLCTLSSAKSLSDSPLNSKTDILRWGFGIFLLMLALVIGAFMGLLQEDLYRKCGKYPKDVLYYTHLLPLPLFAFLYSDLLTAAELCMNSSPLILGHIWSAWLLLLASVVTQYMCIRSVYILTSECTSLTVTLVLTLRKFVSLLLSVALFENTFTASHWLGTLFVFFGTCLYTDIITINKPIGLRGVGRPKLPRLDGITRDARIVDVTNWKNTAENRSE